MIALKQANVNIINSKDAIIALSRLKSVEIDSSEDNIILRFENSQLRNIVAWAFKLYGTKSVKGINFIDDDENLFPSYEEYLLTIPKISKIKYLKARFGKNENFLGLSQERESFIILRSIGSVWFIELRGAKAAENAHKIESRLKKYKQKKKNSEPERLKRVQ